MLRQAITAISFSLCVIASPAQSVNVSPGALVTFYSSGPTVYGKPGSLGAFMGNIYVDGHEFGRLERHRFVTFSLTPGSHVFALSWWTNKNPDRDARLTIDLDADHAYFLSTNFMGTSWNGSSALVIRKVTCEAAIADNADAKPLDPQHLKADGVAALVRSAVFPKCQ